MEQKPKISHYRERLDRTLASADLKNEKTLETLVRNQILRSSKNGVTEHVIQKRTLEVSHFLDMLRSASADDHKMSKGNENARGEWKLKQDNEEFRVMYCEGAEGTPFHNLLVEGYVDGPVDVCLCVSWETELYKKWWPQSSFPPFRITACKSLQRVQVGEQISLVRVKVAWPLSSREAVVHFFLFEYFQDDLIIILLNTVSDLSSVSKETHGFTNDGIPEARDVVRIDVVGGFALQKVTEERSYFRTIANMDMKIDFVPPSLINFIARQLIGGGFRLYQKVVASVLGSEDDYGKALKDPLYAQIREALCAVKSNGVMGEGENNLVEHVNEMIKEDKSNVEHSCYNPETAAEPLAVNDSEHVTRLTEDEKRDMEKNSDDDDLHSASKSTKDILNGQGFSEIVEESEQGNSLMEGVLEAMSQPSKEGFLHDQSHNNRFCPSPEVSQALETLERAISVVRKHRLQRRSFSDNNGDPIDLADVTAKETNSTAGPVTPVHSEDIATLEKPDTDAGRSSTNSKNTPMAHEIRSAAGSSSFSREASNSRVAPLSPPQGLSVGAAEQVTVVNSDEKSIITNGIHEERLSKVRNSKRRRSKNALCCFF